VVVGKKLTRLLCLSAACGSRVDFFAPRRRCRFVGLLAALLFVVFFSLSARCRSTVESILPIVLHSGREFIHVGEKQSYLPDILLGEDAVPGGHTGVTDAGADREENVPLGIIRSIGNQVRNRRIEVLGQRCRLAVEASMSKRAVHVINLHTVD
jgi:hypothetical protein